MANEQAALEKQAKIASIALSELQKAIRFFRLYPPSHPFCTKSVSGTRQRLRRYFDKHGDMLVEVQRDGLYLEDINVLQESGQSTDISTLLYPEGILGLTLETRVSNEELGDFLRILSASYIGVGAGEEGADDRDRDLLTALWEREFTGIRLHIQDQLAPGASNSGNVGLRQIQDRIGELMRRYQGVAANDERIEYKERRIDEELERKLLQLDARPAQACADPLQADAFQSQPQGARRKAMRDELSDFVLHDPGGRASLIVDWATEQGLYTSPETVSRMRAVSALNAVQEGNLDRAVHMLDLLAGEGSTISPVQTTRLGSSKVLRLVAEALEAAEEVLGKDGLIRLGLSYLSRLDPKAVKGTVEVYSSILNDNVRRVFRRYLSAAAATQPGEIEPLTLLEDERFVKEGVGILAMGGKDSEAWEVLKRMAADEETELRSSLAQQVVGKVSGTAQSEKLLKIIQEGQNPEDRKAAAKSLSKTGKPVVFERLVEVVRDKEFHTRGNGEINFIFKAMQKTGGARAIVVLQELAKKKTVLFGRKEHERVRTLASNWLANTKEDRARRRKR